MVSHLRTGKLSSLYFLPVLFFEDLKQKCAKLRSLQIRETFGSAITYIEVILLINFCKLSTVLTAPALKLITLLGTISISDLFLTTVIVL